MNRKKILIFSTAYFPFVGGAEIAIKEITDRLSGDFDFDIITAKLDSSLLSKEKVGEVTVYRIGWGVPLLDKLFLPYIGAWKTWQLHKNNNYICFWGVMASFASGSAYIVNIFRWIVGKKKVPMVLTLQEGDSEKHFKFKRFGLIDFSWRLALNRTDILTAISNYLIERSKKLGFEGKSFLIPNGVSVELFSPVKHRVFDRARVVLITTSRLVEKNAVGDIIKALKLLPENTSLKILGTGALENSLKLLASSLQLEERVEFLNHVSYEDVPKHLRGADIFIRPSLSEGFGNSFIEAMASGLPVIATPVGGIVDFLEDGETGLFCKVKDPESIARAVERLVSDESLRNKITTNAKKMVKERYDWDFIAKEMKEKVFDKVKVQ